MSMELLENLEELASVEIVADAVEPLSEEKEPVEQLERAEAPSEVPEIVTDMEMTTDIAERLSEMPEIRYENWKNLSVEERVAVLNRIEQCAAAIEHRPPVRVVAENMRGMDFGYFSCSQGKIALNVKYLERNDPGMHREMIDTIIHEGRHAYQHYNVDVKMIHESASEVRTWAENFYDPKYQYYQAGHQRVPIRMLDGSVRDADFRLYYYQPVEIDARNYTSEVMAKLESKGDVFAAEHRREVAPEQEASGIDEGVSPQAKSVYESGFDLEHPMLTYDQLRNAGFSKKQAYSIVYGSSHVYSDRELFHCLYESDDPVKAFNEMMTAKARAHIESMEDFFNQNGV